MGEAGLPLTEGDQGSPRPPGTPQLQLYPVPFFAFRLLSLGFCHKLSNSKCNKDYFWRFFTYFAFLILPPWPSCTPTWIEMASSACLSFAAHCIFLNRTKFVLDKSTKEALVNPPFFIKYQNFERFCNSLSFSCVLFINHEQAPMITSN